MPIYEYTCADCDAEFEELVFCSSLEMICPGCGGRHTAKRLSTFAFKSSGRFVSGAKSGCDSCNCGPGSCSGCGH
jgi:putative FmdB family regulatory protein